MNRLANQASAKRKWEERGEKRVGLSRICSATFSNFQDFEQLFLLGLISAALSGARAFPGMRAGSFPETAADNRAYFFVSEQLLATLLKISTFLVTFGLV